MPIPGPRQGELSLRTSTSAPSAERPWTSEFVIDQVRQVALGTRPETTEQDNQFEAPGRPGALLSHDPGGVPRGRDARDSADDPQFGCGEAPPSRSHKDTGNGQPHGRFEPAETICQDLSPRRCSGADEAGRAAHAQAGAGDGPILGPQHRGTPRSLGSSLREGPCEIRRADEADTPAEALRAARRAVLAISFSEGPRQARLQQARRERALTAQADRPRSECGFCVAAAPGACSFHSALDSSNGEGVIS